MAQQKPNLFKFAVAIMAEPGTGATKIMGCQIGDPCLAGTPLDRIPDHVCRDANFLALSLFRDSSEYSPFAYTVALEPNDQNQLKP